MVSIVIERSGSGYQKLLCEGHAGYAKAGEDIVCAAVSILVINTLNAIDRLTTTNYQMKSNDENGYIEAIFHQGMTKEAKLLFDAMVMGLEEVAVSYSRYLSLTIHDSDNE